MCLQFWYLWLQASPYYRSSNLISDSTCNFAQVNQSVEIADRIIRTLKTVAVMPCMAIIYVARPAADLDWRCSTAADGGPACKTGFNNKPACNYYSGWSSVCPHDEFMNCSVASTGWDQTETKYYVEVRRAGWESSFEDGNKVRPTLWQCKLYWTVNT